MRSAASAVTPAMCGESTTWSKAKQRIVLRPAARRRTHRGRRRRSDRLRAAANAVSSTTPPRAVLTTMAPGLSRANSSAPRIGRPAFGRVHRNNVRPAEPSASDATGATAPSGQPLSHEQRIEGADVHAETFGHPREMPPDAAVPDDQQTLAARSRPLRAGCASPRLPARAPRGRRGAPASRRPGSASSHARRPTAELVSPTMQSGDSARVQRGDVDRIVADAVARHDLEPRAFAIVAADSGWVRMTSPSALPISGA